MKSSKALLEACTYHDDAPEKEVSVGDMAKELQEANKTNNYVKALSDRIDECDRMTKEAEEKLKVARIHRAEYVNEIRKYTIIDTAAITEKMNNAEATNKKVRDNADYRTKNDVTKIGQDDYDDLTSLIEQQENEKDAALAAAKMPIPGLGVDDEGVVYEGIPLAQVNKAKRIEIGTAIHMALNPTLRVMFVDGNSFDDETEAAIEAAVKDKDYQLFEEVVDDTSETGIHLVDGTVRRE
jgi:hypothetical protein